jgi:hypothetical protein
MKYSTVEIKTTFTGTWENRNKENPVWGVVFMDDPRDRKRENTKPNPIGFYHYPTDLITRKIAFLALKEAIVQAHTTEIAKLQDSLAKLEALTL